MAFRKRVARKTLKRQGRKTLAKKVARVSKVVRRISRDVLEKKLTDSTVAISNIYTPDTNAASAAYRIIPFNIGQGDQINQRQGQKILAKYISLYYELSHAHSAYANTLSRVRVMVVMDKQPQSSGGSYPGYGDIVQYTSTAQQWPMTPPDVAQGFVNRRFKILYDRHHDLIEYNDSTSTVPTNKSMCAKKIMIPINKVITFNGSSTGSLGRNWVYVFVWSDQVYDGTLVSPKGSFFTRAVYLDN